MRKIAFLTDRTITAERLAPIQSIYREKYGLDPVIIHETNGTDNAEMQQYMLRMEHEGPSWLKPNEEYIREVADAEILVTHFIGVNAEVMDAAKNLKLICVLRSGTENVDIPEAGRRGIAVVNAPGRLAGPVADYTVGMMLAESRNIARSNLTSSGGEWCIRFSNFACSESMEGKRVGLVGLGPIGKSVVSRLLPFGVEAVAYDPYITQESLGNLPCRLTTMEEVMSTSDFICVHARLTEDTRNLIGEREIGMMKRTAYFINTARAGLVNEDALVKALQERRIAGAALDVFQVEPIPKDHPLLKLDNVTLTPHLAGTANNVPEISLGMIESVIADYLAGKPVRDLAERYR